MTSEQEKLLEIFTPKQIKVLKNKAKILTLHGAKRAGKTYVLILKFLMHVRKFKDKGYLFVIGGATKSAIWANILNDMEKILGTEIRLDQYNNFNLYGNTVMVREGSKSDSWKKVRGFTAYGALLNEGTALNEVYIKEVITRCSGSGAKIFIDTNPENPSHFIKKEYIDQAGQKLESGKLNIDAIHFKMTDNTFLDPEYVESIKKATPKGMFYDRDIEGKWVSGEGVIYKDFNPEVHCITMNEFNTKQIIKWWYGLDWGYEHKGSIVQMAEDQQGNIYLVREIAKQHQQIEWWEEQMQSLLKVHKGLIYPDTARPEYVERFGARFNLGITNKSVVEGISCVAGYMKNNKFFVVEENCPVFMEEIYQYVWNEKTGEPVKVNDDVMDAVRYAIYSEKKDFDLIGYLADKTTNFNALHHQSFNALR